MDRYMDDGQRQTDRHFYCQRHSTCEQMYLKATSPSTLYSYVTNGLDIQTDRQTEMTLGDQTGQSLKTIGEKTCYPVAKM